MEDDELQDEESAEEQAKNSPADRIRPWQFKRGQSGNPGGRPKGSVSLKEFAKRYLMQLDDEEKLEFLEGINKDKVWEMAEGRAKTDVELSGELTSKIIAVDE